jgi:sialate O-acetylesterase
VLKQRRFISGMLVVGLVLCVAGAAGAEVKLPRIFWDHMVLQRDIAVPVWGTATAGDTITVSFAGQTKTATADQDGKWRVALDPLKASSEARTLAVQSKIDNRQSTFSDVLVGEVWFCSGQSNMVWPVNKSADGPAEIAAAKHPLIRHARGDIGRWSVVSPETVGSMTAVGYYFGRHLHKELKVPVGLIQSAVGGTPIQAWTAHEAMAADPVLKVMIDEQTAKVKEYDPARAQKMYEAKLAVWEKLAAKLKVSGKKPPRKPAPPRPPKPSRFGGLFYNKVQTAIPYAIRGAIWYQGESNAGRPELYRTQFPVMIRDWRKRWGQGDFPFGFVQLANFLAVEAEPADSLWARLREAQSLVLKTEPNTGQAVIIDIGEARNIHPKNKQEVGRRLALWALATTYGRKIPYSGPLFRSHKIEGGKIVLTFDHAYDGLAAKGGGELKGFAIAGEDQKFIWATATIRGNTVIVSSDKVAAPSAVRYAWSNNPICNLTNSANLPASPFRTDNWERAKK